MSNEQIIEGNILIAEFMGYEVFAKHCVRIYDNMTTTIELWAKYHSSWDWLMPVVKKIDKENINIGKRSDFTPAGTSVEMSFYVPYEVSMWNETGWSIVIKKDTPFKSLWLAVVEFIKWYNQIKP